jgi:hypothetical protein
MEPDYSAAEAPEVPSHAGSGTTLAKQKKNAQMRCFRARQAQIKAVRIYAFVSLGTLTLALAPVHCRRNALLKMGARK